MLRLWNSLWERRSSSVQINDLPLSEWDCANQRGGMGEMLKAQVSSARRKGNLAVKEAQASQPGPPTEDAEREFACLASWDPRATQTEMCGTDHSNSHASAEKELHMTFLRGYSWSCLRRDAQKSRNAFLEESLPPPGDPLTPPFRQPQYCNSLHPLAEHTALSREMCQHPSYFRTEIRSRES